MPLGFNERFTYGDPRSSVGVNGALVWSGQWSPLIEYEAVYSYRSGKRSRNMQTAGSYGSSVRAGRDLVSQLAARKKYLEDFIRDSFEPSVGNSSVVSTTDVGHPFATFKVRTQNSYARITQAGGPTATAYWDVCNTTVGLPYPDLLDPFGFIVRADSLSNGTNPLAKQAYFVWPSNLLAGQFPNAASSQQTISHSTKLNLGAGLIANTNPYAAKADLAVTVGELLTGNLPRLLGRISDSLTRFSIDWKLQTGKTLDKHTNPGNEWLSYHFGWAPFVSDIVNAISTLYKLHMLLHGASDNSRRHRGGTLATTGRTVDTLTSAGRIFNIGSPIISSDPTAASTKLVKAVTYNGNGLPIPSGPNNTGARWSKTVNIAADYRFSARFHSGARANSRELGYLDRALELLGADITPSTLWNLAPWTWLLDWFSNLGTIAQNLSDLDWSNVLLDYAYLTLVVETKASMGVQLPPTWSTGFSSSHPYIGHVVTTTEKIREQASPLGFSVSWDGLSPFQLSILAALGMTRGR